ncbi:response regulator [Prosthecobacter sp. SYSU 5D2]|uniref:response regulator n=1 Tax=Prosthecobacter sp. SYSU 5D2 TaxID=3134134 RepID=UPI0031FE5FF2
MSDALNSSSDNTLCIFVVEDNADTLKYLTRQLVKQGHQVLCATSMRQALEDLPAAGCDVLISDIGLPDGDGWQLLKEVRLKQTVYAIAMSGYGMASDRAKSREAGFRHHLLKPFSKETLRELLAEAVREKGGRMTNDE